MRWRPDPFPTPGAVAITPQAEYERRAVHYSACAAWDATMMRPTHRCSCLSDAASFINGDILHVDGGFLAS